MRWDILLEWMTHLGSGRWGAFREAVAELSGARDTELQGLCRTLRVALSDLGHVDFFVEGTRRWKVLKPVLTGFGPSRAQAVLRGGRTQRLVDALSSATEAAGVELLISDIGFGLSLIHVGGTATQASKVAAAIGVEFIPNAAALVAARLTPIRRVLADARIQEEPLNWEVRSWSLEEMCWVDGRLPKTAREYSNRHGGRRYMVEVGKGRLCEIDKRESVFAAALIHRTNIATYCNSEQVLGVPLAAPLPDLFARAACLASGGLPTATDGHLRFAKVPPETAAVLLVSLGQRLPIEGAIQ